MASNYIETTKGTSNWAKENRGWFSIGWFSGWFSGKSTVSSSNWTEISKS